MSEEIREKQINKIFSEMRTVHKIRCSNCSIVSVLVDCDEHEAVSLFYDEGWRAGKAYLYCPRCAEANGKL